MPNYDDDKELTTTIASVWLHEKGGNYRMSGSVDKKTLIEATELAGSDEYQLTVWLDVESVVGLPPEHKRPTKSGGPARDGRIVLAPYRGPARKRPQAS